MTTEEKRYTITLTETELANAQDVLRASIDRDRRFTGRPLEIDTKTIAALDAAKPIRVKKVAAPTAFEPLIPTGDAALDTFIETHHRPDWRTRLAAALKNRPGMMRMPAAPKGHDAVALKPHERSRLYEAFNVRETRVSA